MLYFCELSYFILRSGNLPIYPLSRGPLTKYPWFLTDIFLLWYLLQIRMNPLPPLIDFSPVSVQILTQI